MEEFKISNMYDLNETIAADYMKTKEYPWELLAGIKDNVLELCRVTYYCALTNDS